MLRRLYSLIYWIVFWPRALLGRLQLGVPGEQGDVFRQRLGRFRANTKQALTNRQKLWVHANSREAVALATHLLVRLERRAPFLKMVISTSRTETMVRLRRVMPVQVQTMFVPFDFWRSVQRTVNLIHPEALVLLDPEIRPNLMRRLRHRKIPALLLQASQGERLPRRYRFLPPLYRPFFRTLAGVAVSDQAGAERLQRVGCPAENIETVGEWPPTATVFGEQRPLDVPDLLGRVGVPAGATLLVAGRTHPGEERAVAEAYLQLRSRFPNLFLVLVPENYRRGKEVGRELKALQLRYVYRTAVSSMTRLAASSTDCLLVNTRDEVSQFEAYATLVFVGGSLTQPGRANLVEPGIHGKPLVFGPQVQHCEVLARALIEGGAGVGASEGAGLEPALERVLADPAAWETMGAAARRIVEDARDSVDHAIDLILRHLDSALADRRFR